MEIRIHATHLPDLPEPNLTGASIERLTMASNTPEEAAFLRQRLKEQVLSHLDAAYAIPLFPGIVEREFATLWNAAESEGLLPSRPEERASADERLRAIAERRLRLGLVVAELARRFDIRAADGAALEDLTIDRLLAEAGLPERAVSADELRELMQAIES